MVVIYIPKRVSLLEVYSSTTLLSAIHCCRFFPMNKDSRGTCKHEENQRLIKAAPSYYFLPPPSFVRIPYSVGQESISDSRALLVHSSIL